MDYSGVVVLDTGSSCVKVGYSGEDEPRYVFPTVVGHPVVGSENYRKPAPPTYRDEEYVSKDDIEVDHVNHSMSESAHATCDDGGWVHPVSRGRVVDWDAMEKVWDYALTVGLDMPEGASPSQPQGGGGCCPVLLTEAPHSDAKSRERSAQYLFESAGVPSLVVASSAVCSLFASGRTQGIVLECGGGYTAAVPVFEGFALSHATLRVDLGGSDLTTAVRECFLSGGQSQDVDPSVLSWEVVQRIKEASGFVRPTLSGGAPPVDKPSDRTTVHGQAYVRGKAFELPDGTILALGDSLRCGPIESLLFPEREPSSPGYANTLANVATQPGELPTPADAKEGVAALVHRSIAMCDAELQPDLWRNVVCAGGTTLLPHFPSRLEAELRALPSSNPSSPHSPPNALPTPFSHAAGFGHKSLGSRTAIGRNAIGVVPDPVNPERGYNAQRGHAAWVGGSVFGSLDTFAHVAVTRAEWEEHGASIVHKKCF
mmetsp:Transcript_20622/g.42281  ORF Transcript_20622/g.42281 Transcript_20622/m.42281 type:complete len:485 (+) Transcript_20622:44-1498(+)